jgi:hypothetical protein
MKMGLRLVRQLAYQSPSSRTLRARKGSRMRPPIRKPWIPKPETLLCRRSGGRAAGWTQSYPRGGGVRRTRDRRGSRPIPDASSILIPAHAHGPEGLIDRKAPGQPARLNESGPMPAVHGVVRWRLIDLCQWIFEEFRLTIAKHAWNWPSSIYPPGFASFGRTYRKVRLTSCLMQR